MPSRVCDEQAGATLGQPREQVAGGVVADGSVCVIRPNVGPASSSWTIRNVVAPGDLVAGPDRVLHGRGAPPRGSTEKCRFTQPCSGMSSADCGSRAP